MNFNQDAWRLVEEKVNAVVEEKVNAVVEEKVNAVVEEKVNAAIAAHEAKAAGATFTNSHVVAAD